MRRRPVAASIVLLLLPVASLAQRGCHKIELDGAVTRGQEFQRQLGGALTFDLQPLPSGWRIRVLNGESSALHDAAEVATPPYRSINPLLLTTDFSFRAQDVISWNPRQFQFVTSPDAAKDGANNEEFLVEGDGTPEAQRRAQSQLVELASKASHGELRITDASLVPGTADQSPAAQGIASHWRTTAHTLVQPENGKSATPLGEIESLKFRVTLWLPRSVELTREWRHAALVSCPQ